MKVILSPARNNQPAECAAQPTRPQFMAQTVQLVALLREYQPYQLESLLDVPPARAFDLYDAYQSFDAAAPGSPALLSYYGAAYRNMQPADFNPDELLFAQEHLRIFSALYGMLRPLDGVLVHRLGLKKQFSPGGQDLHAFWGDKLYQELFKTGEVVVNLASVEYAKLVTEHMRPGDRMLTCRFLVQKAGGIKATVSTIRPARGLMARFIVKNRIENPEWLKEFSEDGYGFAPASSSPDEYVFIKRKGFAQDYV